MIKKTLAEVAAIQKAKQKAKNPTTLTSQQKIMLEECYDCWTIPSPGPQTRMAEALQKLGFLEGELRSDTYGAIKRYQQAFILTKAGKIALDS